MLTFSAEASSEPAKRTVYMYLGGLLYPCGALFGFLKKLENLFTEYFSKEKLQIENILDLLAEQSSPTALAVARCIFSCDESN